MVRRNVPMYQARIPIRGGGRLGQIDLTRKPEVNPIVQALQQMVQQKRQQEKDALSEQLIEARIGEMGQEKQRQGKIVKAGDKWLFIDPVTGETIREIPTPPESGRKVLEEIAKSTKAAEGIRESTLEQPIIDAIIEPQRQKAIKAAGFEEVPGREVRRTEPHWYLPEFMEDWLAPDITAAEGGKVLRKRKKVESKAVKPVSAKAKKRPPKPKGYPNAVWNEEHQMWTIVKNGRLMGIE